MHFTIAGDERGPSAEHRLALLELMTRYATLRDDLGCELVKLSDQYTASLGKDAGADFPRPRTSDEALEVFTLTQISIDDPTKPVLLFTYRELDDDAMFEIAIEEDALQGKYAGD